MTDSINHQLLQQVSNPFSDIPPSNNIHADWQSHHVDRTMQHYESVMQWIRLFLFNERLATFAGSEENVSLLFPMEEVFEDFVTYSFRRYQKEFDLVAQGPPKALATIDNRPVFNMKPDIALKQQGAVQFILDAKWKRVDVNSDGLKHGISQSDMYQLFAYGKNYKCKTVALVYPKSDKFKELLRYRFAEGDMDLICFPFDVESPDNSVVKIIKCLQDSII